MQVRLDRDRLAATHGASWETVKGFAHVDCLYFSPSAQKTMHWRVPRNRLFKEIEIEELSAVRIKGKVKDQRHSHSIPSQVTQHGVLEYDELQLADVLTAVRAWDVCLGVWLAKSIHKKIHLARQVHWEVDEHGRLRYRIMAFLETFMDDECKSVPIVHSESCISSKGTKCTYKSIRSSNDYKTFMKDLHSQHPYILEVLQMCLQGTHFNFQNNFLMDNSELQPWLLSHGFELDETENCSLNHFDRSLDHFKHLREFEVAHEACANKLKAADFISEQDKSSLLSLVQIMDKVIKKQPENSMVRSALTFRYDCPNRDYTVAEWKARGLDYKVVMVKGLQDLCRRDFVQAFSQFQAAQLLTNDTSLNLLIKLTVCMINITQGQTVFSCAPPSARELEDSKKLLFSLTEFIPLEADFEKIVNELNQHMLTAL